MTSIPNELALRPRFQLTLDASKDEILSLFETSTNKKMVVSRVDDHVFLRFKKEESHFWSPQLHLEINEEGERNCVLHGLYGPNPTLWTFFMFLHFGVATLFIGIGIWLYARVVINKPFGVQLGLMVFLVVVWFVLYFLGRAGRQKGRPQMRELENYMQTVLKR